MKVTHKQIPTFNCSTKTWTYTDFESQKHFGEFLNSVWNDDCDYFFDKDSQNFNASARTFLDTGKYTHLTPFTTEWVKYWDGEKEKNMRGAIYKSKDKTWYLTRDLYFLLNFLQIPNKEEDGKNTFPYILDLQYHLSLYEKRAEVLNFHSAVTKKRQCLSTLFHCAKLYNRYCFDENSVIKIFASDESYLKGETGLWKYFINYKEFLIKNTAWIRYNLPDQELKWQQKREYLDDSGNKRYKGNMSVMSGLTTKANPTKGVGGMSHYGFAEEAGIYPNLDKTYRFFKSGVEAGVYTTGMFIAAGSVGDLQQCEPLKNYMYAPEANGFLGVQNKWTNENGIVKRTGLFIPEHWGMPGFIDEYGNSLKEEAKEYLIQKYKDMENNPDVKKEEFYTEVSQHPIYLDDAFRYRNDGTFESKKLEKRQKEIKLLIERNEFPISKGYLDVDKDGNIFLKKYTENAPPEMEYPVDPKLVNKKGLVCIRELPKNERNLYFGGVDTVEVGITDTSNSLFSIYIYKRGHSVVNPETGEKTLKRGKIVAWYTGRCDNADDHNEQGLLLLRMYKAKAACERNKPNFINYCRRMGFSASIARRSELPFHKDIDVTAQKNDDYGVWKGNDGQLELEIIRVYKEYLTSEMEVVHKKEENDEEDLSFKIIKTIRGYDYIDDYWLLEELKRHNGKDNADRFIASGLAFCYGIAEELTFAKVIYESSEVSAVIKDTNTYKRQSYLPTSNKSRKRSFLQY